MTPKYLYELTFFRILLFSFILGMGKILSFLSEEKVIILVFNVLIVNLFLDVQEENIWSAVVNVVDRIMKIFIRNIFNLSSA